MGSKPWKARLRRFLEEHWSSETLRVEKPNGDVIEGMFTGTGDIDGRTPAIIVNNAPPECPPPGSGLTREQRDAAWAAHGRDWFSYDQWIVLERGVKINGVDAPDFRGVPT